jgi:hypothetical protein
VSEDGKKVDYTALRQSPEYAKYREIGNIMGLDSTHSAWIPHIC